MSPAPAAIGSSRRPDWTSSRTPSPLTISPRATGTGAVRRSEGIPITIIRSLEDRLLAKVDRLYGSPPEHRPELGPCWPWMGAKNANGYGIIRGEIQPGGARGASSKSRQPLLLAHRVALSLALGRPIDEGMLANHHCDNRPCCRPRHLYEGTDQDNVDDMYDRGRAKRPPIRRKRLG